MRTPSKPAGPRLRCGPNSAEVKPEGARKTDNSRDPATVFVAEIYEASFELGRGPRTTWTELHRAQLSGELSFNEPRKQPMTAGHGTKCQ